MSAFAQSPRLQTVRCWMLAAAFTPLGVLLTTGMHTEVIANRFVRKIGISGISFNLESLLDVVLKPAEGAGRSEIKDLIVAIVALVLLSAIVIFAFGIMKMMGGRRGGIEAVGQVVFALIVGIAGFSVLA